MNRPAWHYDELRHSGVDYSDPSQVAVYDERHKRFRDYRREAEAVIERLGVRLEDTVLDMGAGTGAFALHAAPLCRTVYAVDVSRAMLEYCRGQAAARDLKNIVFRQGGFLTYAHTADPVDFIVSSGALHHLPDFWKYIGLRRLARILKPGGRLYLFDIVFPGGEEDLRGQMEAWIGSMKEEAGDTFAAEVETHIRDEHSTYDWIMEGMLERAGFRIDQADYADGFRASYLCTNRN
ncbi:MAG: class I SAM-dependent methyltransferase [Anaerolineales bacterium]|nr:class I SAM-dependent methyltransferase [Anaerolineales bacterium]